MHHFKTHLRQKLLNLNISSYHFILFWNRIWCLETISMMGFSMVLCSHWVS
jgi:hypothetical protein